MKNKLIFKVFLVFVLGVLLFTMLPINVYAVEGNKDLYIDGHKIETIYYGEGGTRGYFNPGPFTFYGDHNGQTRYFDGTWMAMEAIAGSVVLIPLHIDLLIYNTNTHHDCVVWTNGYEVKFDWLYLGNTGGSSSDNYYYVASQYSSYSVTVDVKLYSWI